MTKRYSILQAKLHELESILSDALLHDPETQSHYSLSQDIKQKFVFIGNLLSAEVASHPSKPHHLQHISQRLAHLEKAFQEWDTHRTFPYQEFDKDSTCSCTESCFNDDGEALDEADLDVFEDPEVVSPGFIGDKALVKFDGGVVEATALADDGKGTGKVRVGFGKLASSIHEDAKENIEGFTGDKELVEFDSVFVRKRGLANKEWKDIRNVGPERDALERAERRDSALGKKCCSMAVGVVLGMVLMGFIMVNFSGCFHSVDQVSFAIPT